MSVEKLNSLKFWLVKKGKLDLFIYTYLEEKSL